MAIFELMMTPKIREMTFRQAGTVEIRKAARKEGMNVLLEYGIRKVFKGVTTVEEVLRITRMTEQ